MFVPFFTKRSEDNKPLYRRKGGGGKGGGSSGGAKSSGGGGGGGGSARSSSISSGGGSKSATSYGGGGGRAITIPSGQPFAGRSAGGGTRSQVAGTQTYGSGYPGLPARSVAGRGFPFFFWPLAWGGVAGVGTAAYLHDSEYGRFDNSSRPGGIMMTASFNSSSSQPTTFRLVADNTTVTSLITDIVANCTSANLASPGSIVATTYNDSLASPKPEQVVQYYRASSVALSLDGYNDTAALAADGTPDTPLPTNIDTTLLNCLNFTIAAAVPLVDSALPWAVPPTSGLLGIAYLVWSLSSLI
ncbi:hypothetical protein BDN70DRAFT_989357 [Pholiota conissans]|uniref:Uncharacterized protein n=1 Tax=Pholiota conissans TaxID=109636 RepID=A0A9P6D5L2_9AGAR|nr:hypothetical protein BDN70DRAFT_989357 [Pholiota conissans]